VRPAAGFNPPARWTVSHRISRRVSDDASQR
jgi:hypothetical protein